MMIVISNDNSSNKYKILVQNKLFSQLLKNHKLACEADNSNTTLDTNGSHNE